MSSQRGNVNRSRPQKHKNATKFSNTRHDKSQRTKEIVSLTVDGLCARCKEKIEWKIKYKKYKPLTKPATCTKCHQKTVKKSYYIVCEPCATAAGICAKCSEKKEIVLQYQGDERSQAAEQSELEQELQMMSERQRRTFFRLQEQGKLKNLSEDGHVQKDSDEVPGGQAATISDEDSDVDDGEIGEEDNAMDSENESDEENLSTDDKGD